MKSIQAAPYENDLSMCTWFQYFGVYTVDKDQLKLHLQS